MFLLFIVSNDEALHGDVSIYYCVLSFFIFIFALKLNSFHNNYYLQHSNDLLPT